MTVPKDRSEMSINIAAGLQTNVTNEGSQKSGMEELVNCTTITPGVLEVRKGMRPISFENE
jgi:hypothetical protein